VNFKLRYTILKLLVLSLAFSAIDIILLEHLSLLSFDDNNKESFLVHKVPVSFKTFKNFKESNSKILPKEVKEDMLSCSL
jgi:hypothetical protein